MKRRSDKTLAKIDEIVGLFQSGMTVTKIAWDLSMCSKTVRDLLIEAGVYEKKDYAAQKKRNYSAEIIESVFEMRQSGKTIHEIAKTLHICTRRTANILAQRGMNTRIIEWDESVIKNSQTWHLKPGRKAGFSQVFPHDPAKNTSTIYLIGYPEIPDNWRNDTRAVMGMPS